jgi:hypothetical protein
MKSLFQILVTIFLICGVHSKIFNENRELSKILLNVFNYEGCNVIKSSWHLPKIRKVVMAVVKQENAMMCEYAITYFKDDKDLILEAVKNDGSYLKVASKRLKDDKDVVMESVKSCYHCLKFASKRLRDDNEIVMVAIKTEFLFPGPKPNLAWASDRIKDNEEIVWEALKTWVGNIQYLSERLLDDKNFALEFLYLYLSKGDYIFLLDEYEQEFPICRECYNRFDSHPERDYNQFFTHFSKRLKDDKDIALIGVKINGYNLVYVSKRLKDDYQIVFEAIMHHGFYLKYASERLKNNNTLIDMAIKNCKESFILCQAEKVTKTPCDPKILKEKIYKRDDFIKYINSKKTYTYYKNFCLGAHHPHLFA